MTSKWRTWLLLAGSVGTLGIIGVLKERTIALQFGVSAEYGRIQLALNICSFLTMILFGALQSCAVAILVGTESRLKRQLFDELVGVVAALMTLMLVGSAVVLMLTSSAAEFLRFSSYLGLALLTAFSGLSLLLHAPLLLRGRVVASLLVPCVSPALVVIILVVCRPLDPDLLLWMYAGGGLAEVVILLTLLRLLSWPVGVRWPRSLFISTPFTKEFFALVVAVSFHGLFDFADQIAAGMIGSEAVAIQYYASRLPFGLVSIGVLIIGKLALARFSAEIEKNGTAAFHHIAAQMGLFVVLSFGFGCLLAAYLSENLVAVLFGGGAFALDLVPVVGTIQAGYLLTLPFFLLAVIPARMLLCMQRSWTLTRVYVIAGLVKLALSLTLMTALGLFAFPVSAFAANNVLLCLLVVALRKALRESAVLSRPRKA